MEPLYGECWYSVKTLWRHLTLESNVTVDWYQWLETGNARFYQERCFNKMLTLRQTGSVRGLRNPVAHWWYDRCMNRRSRIDSICPYSIRLELFKMAIRLVVGYMKAAAVASLAIKVRKIPSFIFWSIFLMFLNLRLPAFNIIKYGATWLVLTGRCYLSNDTYSVLFSPDISSYMIQGVGIMLQLFFEETLQHNSNAAA